MNSGKRRPPLYPCNRREPRSPQIFHAASVCVSDFSSFCGESVDQAVRDRSRYALPEATVRVDIGLSVKELNAEAAVAGVRRFANDNADLG